MDTHYKPETVVRPSRVYNGDPYTHNAASILWLEGARAGRMSTDSCYSFDADVYSITFSRHLSFRYGYLNPHIKTAYLLFVNISETRT